MCPFSTKRFSIPVSCTAKARLNPYSLYVIVTERHSSARKEALAKLRLITDRIMLRRVKREHTAAMELPPKR